MTIGFIEPCLPSPADRLPDGPDWVHEIKHDGYRLIARQDPIGIRLLTRNGYDWSPRYPLIVEAVNRLKVRSCLIDGEAVACDANGLAVFEHLRRKPTGRHVCWTPSTCWSLTARTCGVRHSRPARRRSPACCGDVCRACG
jgi:ATP-dependent DNA ligase